MQGAAATMLSFSGKQGWEPRFFDGWTPETLPDELKWDPQPDSRAADHVRNSPKAAPYKQACAMNHLRVALACQRLDEPVAFVEHDARCLGDWVDFPFKGFLIMNAQAGIDKLSGTVGRKAESRGVSGVLHVAMEAPEVPSPLQEGVFDARACGLRDDASRGTRTDR